VAYLDWGIDTALLGDGDDYADGSYNGDLLQGENGNDTLIGGYSTDRLLGGNDDDTLYGGVENDSLEGGAGNDVLYGDDPYAFDTPGNDTLQGGTGSDTYYGFNGTDVITDAAGDADYLITQEYFAYFNINGYTFQALDSASDADAFLDALLITEVTTGDSIRINNYFGNDTTVKANTVTGTGTIEYIEFYDNIAVGNNNNQLTFSEVKTLLA
jgi:Ca2+-binding RTX toxin-like protein